MAATLMLPFAPRFLQLGQTAMKSLRTYGYDAFNGVHLRIEEDALSRVRRKSFDDLLSVYSRALSAMGMNSSLPMYVASGIDDFEGSEWKRVTKMLLAGHASKVLHLKSLVPGIDTQGILCEQLAIVDMFMLAVSERYIGINYSTFSVLTAILRSRLNRSSETAALINLRMDTNSMLMQFIRDATFVTEIREFDL